MQRARHMRRSLARRRGQSDTRQARGRVGTNQPQKFRHRRRLSRTRPARNQHKRLKQGKPRRIPLPCAAFVGKPAGQVLRRAHPIHRLDFRFCQTLDFSHQIMLELPHPPQKQLSALQHQRRRALPDRRRQSRQFVRLALIQPHKRVPVLQSRKQPQHIRRQHRSMLRYATLQQMPGRLSGGKVQIIGGILSHFRFPCIEKGRLKTEIQFSDDLYYIGQNKNFRDGSLSGRFTSSAIPRSSESPATVPLHLRI